MEHANVVCQYCRRPDSKRLKVDGQPPSCRACVRDYLNGHPPGITAAKGTVAFKITCPHCKAKPKQPCTGPGVVRFTHAQRRDLAARKRNTIETLRRLRKFSARALT
jgi:hypothetical protein